MGSVYSSSHTRCVSCLSGAQADLLILSSSFWARKTHEPRDVAFGHGVGGLVRWQHRVVSVALINEGIFIEIWRNKDQRHVGSARIFGMCLIDIDRAHYIEECNLCIGETQGSTQIFQAKQSVHITEVMYFFFDFRRVDLCLPQSRTSPNESTATV